MSIAAHEMPVFVSSGDDVASVAIRLALAIKGVEFKAGDKPPLEGTPALYADNSWHVGFIAILDALEQYVAQPSLFPNGNRGMPIALKYWSDQFLADGMTADYDADIMRGHLSLIARQMEDGRDFLQGHEPGLADILSFAPIAILKKLGRDVMALLGDGSLLENWYQRMQRIQGN